MAVEAMGNRPSVTERGMERSAVLTADCILRGHSGLWRVLLQLWELLLKRAAGKNRGRLPIAPREIVMEIKGNSSAAPECSLCGHPGHDGHDGNQCCIKLIVRMQRTLERHNSLLVKREQIPEFLADIQSLVTAEREACAVRLEQEAAKILAPKRVPEGERHRAYILQRGATLLRARGPKGEGNEQG